MFIFKDINTTSAAITNNLVHYTHNLSASAGGISSIKVTSGSKNNNYWSSLNVLFYTSGSPVYGDKDKFAKPSSNLSLDNKTKAQYLNKFHGYASSSVISIPQQYYGEKIKEGSFVYTDKNNLDNNGDGPTIKDDGFGNLYSTNANSNWGTLTGSSNSISSSDNYVGNIFYSQGIAVITETGSWSGSVNYSDLGTNYNIDLDSSNTITTHEYDVTINPNEFNYSTNYSLRAPLSNDDKPLNFSTKFLKSEFTSSDFSPYITSVKLYQDGVLDEPVMEATFPRPIRKSNKISTTFKIKLDI
tara:strand:- start:92 stop:991 length:900 start_codon:yes stop_codon:yes gene_type:complete